MAKTQKQTAPPVANQEVTVVQVPIAMLVCRGCSTMIPLQKARMLEMVDESGNPIGACMVCKAIHSMEGRDNGEAR